MTRQTAAAHLRRSEGFCRSGPAILLMPLAGAVWNFSLRPSGLTIGRTLIVVAAGLLLVEWLTTARPRPSFPQSVSLAIVGIIALWALVVINAEIWGRGTSGGDLYALSELAALSVVAMVACTLEPELRRRLVFAVLAGGALEAALALAGVHGLTPGTTNTSAVQGRLTGTFGNPNELGIALAFSVPAGLAALRMRPRWRLAIVAALLLVIVALGLTLSRSAILAAGCGGAVVIVFAQPPRSWRRRGTVAAIAIAAVAVGVSYPMFTHLRQHAESRPIDPALRSRDRSGWDGTRLGLVRTGGSKLSNPAAGELEVGTRLAGQGVSHSIGPARANGRYQATFEVRTVRGSARLGYRLEDGISPNGRTAKRVLISPQWRRLRLRWRPSGQSPNADLSVWSETRSAGFVIRGVRVSAQAPGLAANLFAIDTRLDGSVYAGMVARQRTQQHRDIESRLFAARTSLKAFSTQPLRGIGWDRFTEYSSTHGDYGNLPTHDDYLRFLAELGALGALLLAFIAGITIRAARNGERDELGVAVFAMLVTGAVALLFINGLEAPDLMMPLAFTAAIACSRARVSSLRVAIPRIPIPQVAIPRIAVPRVAVPRVPIPHIAIPRVAIPRVATRYVARPVPLNVQRFWRALRDAAPLPAPPRPAELRVAGAVRLAPAARPLLGRAAPTQPAPAASAVRVPADTASAPPVRGRSPSPPSGYRPALDGIRAVAVLAVIAYHMSTGVPGGFLGVDVFFVLSGYLITSILLRQMMSQGRIRFAEFWARRARRLLPAVLLLVLVCAFQVYEFAPVSTWALRRSDLLSTVFYYANWHFIATDQSYFAGFLGASPVRHTWTLAIEEQFYLVWPLIVFACYRLARGPRLLVAVIVGVMVASTIEMALLYTAADPSRAYFGTDTRAGTLLAGAGLAMLVRYRPEWLKAPGRTIARWSWAPVALVTLAAFALVPDHSPLYYWGGSLVFALLVALALFIVEAAPAGELGRGLSMRPLPWIGKISYGLYLWYWPILIWTGGWLPGHGNLRKLAELVTMFAAATASFYVVEQPIRNGRMPWVGLSRRRLVLALPILVFAIVFATVRLTTITSASLAAQLKPLTPLACAHQQTLTGPYSWCPREIGKSGAPVVASIGDSTSEALYPGMRVAARQRGWTYIEAAEGGCSVLPLQFVEFDTSQDLARARLCNTDIPKIIAEVQAQYRPNVWVLSDRWPIATLVTRSGRSLSPTDPRRDEPIERALHRMLAGLTADGARVLMVSTPPFGEPVDCALHRVSATTCDEAAFTTRDASTARLSRIVHRAVRELPRVTLVGIDDVVCPDDGHCPGVIDGTVVRYDSVHYSAAYSLQLVPIILTRAERLGLTFARRHE